MKEDLSLRGGMSVRQRQLIFAVLAGCFILGILIWGTTMPESAYAVDYGQKNLVPSAAHPFGTDYMGRDMLLRSVKGMSISLQIGIAAAFVSSCIALLLGTLSAAFGGKVDQFVLWLVDLCMGIPHILLILMISVMMGGGVMGVSIGVIVTHWPRLTRIIRAEARTALYSGGAAVRVLVGDCGTAAFRPPCPAAVHHRARPAISPCDHARSRNQFSRVWSAAGYAGNWHHPLGVDALPRTRHVVACVLPGIFAAAHCADL